MPEVLRNELRRELAPVRKVLNLVVAELLDPWDKIYSEMEPLLRRLSSEIRNPRQNKRSVGKATRCQIKPRLILDNTLEASDLSTADLNSPRNLLRLSFHLITSAWCLFLSYWLPLGN
ncbi:hypothetical protein EON65_54380 [archaeon]|nr:MAG: hypothetical protein EON65_54380 [archaeon]